MEDLMSIEGKLSLKIGTYNIHHGSVGGRYCTAIGKLLEKHDLDIVGIQEIDLFIQRSGNINVLKEIAEAGNYPYYEFYKTIDYQGGDFGIGIISKYPITTKAIVPLSHCTEPRVVAHSSIDIDNYKLDFLVTHFDLGIYEDVRYFQFNELKEILEPLRTFVITGDFNVQNWLEKGNVFEFNNHFQNLNIANNPNNSFLTYSGKENVGDGISPIDNILTSPDIEILDTYMVDTYYSDHDLLISKIIIHY
jgi:endonuclease/exonuclease/phosphatase family metal-dependent hydrolase